MSSPYVLHSPVFLTNSSFGLSFIRDVSPGERKQSVEFHISSGDYFGTIATVLGLIADSLAANDSANRERCIRTLSELQEDLAYLQETHTIGRKN